MAKTPKADETHDVDARRAKAGKAGQTTHKPKIERQNAKESPAAQSTKSSAKTSQNETVSRKSGPVDAKKPKKPKAGKKRRRPRSRGKRQNKRTAQYHATNALEQAADVQSDASSQSRSKTPHDPRTQNEPPEEFAPGPSVTLFGEGSNLNREAEVLQAMMQHEAWVVPEVAFQYVPHKLTKIVMNIGIDKETGQELPERGDWTTNQQLTAAKFLQSLHRDNFKKLRALKPQELRVFNEVPAAVTTEDQRAIILGAIASELQRRQSGGAISHRPDRASAGDSGAGDSDDEASVDADDEDGMRT